MPRANYCHVINPCQAKWGEIVLMYFCNYNIAQKYFYPGISFS